MPRGRQIPLPGLVMTETTKITLSAYWVLIFPCEVPVQISHQFRFSVLFSSSPTCCLHILNESLTKDTVS